jgi:hypothetical protein
MNVFIIKTVNAKTTGQGTWNYGTLNKKTPQEFAQVIIIVMGVVAQ